RLREPRELERVLDEALDSARRQIARVRDRDLLADHHAHADRPAARLLDQLGLTEPHLGGEVRALPHHRLGHVCAELLRALDDALTERDQLIQVLSGHARAPQPTWVPPTVMPAILIVGQPTPTGTLCPSLPQVQMPSESSMSFPSIVTLRMTSGPFPIRFTPLSGAVILPSSIR